jgi:hypothetical protein
VAWRLGPGYLARLAAEAQVVGEAYRAVAERDEHQDAQEARPGADVVTGSAGLGGQQ